MFYSLSPPWFFSLCFLDSILASGLGKCCGSVCCGALIKRDIIKYSIYKSNKFLSNSVLTLTQWKWYSVTWMGLFNQAFFRHLINSNSLFLRKNCLKILLIIVEVSWLAFGGYWWWLVLLMCFWFCQIISVSGFFKCQMRYSAFLDQVELSISRTRKYIVAGSLSLFLAGNSDVSCCSPWNVHMETADIIKKMPIHLLFWHWLGGWGPFWTPPAIHWSGRLWCVYVCVRVSTECTTPHKQVGFSATDIKLRSLITHYRLH